VPSTFISLPVSSVGRATGLCCFAVTVIRISSWGSDGYCRNGRFCNRCSTIGLNDPWFVSLAGVADPELVRSAVATALGVRELPEQPAAQALTDHLRSRRLLLVLDNFEHLLPAAVVAAELLDAAPELTVLATSRAPLRLSGEQEYPLAPLPLPRPEELAADLLGNDALALFADRASAVDPHFVLGADNAPLIAEAVARLDGLPLAIELAAARLRLFPLEELARRLSPAIALLTGGPVDRTARQRTLRDAIAWSDQLLGPADRALFHRLGVFQGGFTLEAAEAVARAHPSPTSPRASPRWWMQACSGGW